MAFPRRLAWFGLIHAPLFGLVLAGTACKSAEKKSRALDAAAPAAGASAGDPSLLIAFAAKGTNVGIDGGFMHALYEQHLSAVQQGKVVVSGSSSGSIMAAIFGCWGFNEDGLAVMDALLEPSVFDKTKIDLPSSQVLEAVAAGKADVVRNPQSHLDGIIETLSKGKTCVPHYPMVIAAANHENLDAVWHLKIPTLSLWSAYLKLIHGVSFWTPYAVPFKGNTDVQVDMNAYTVVNTHSGSNAAPTYLGRGCTYFVDESMYAALKEVPSDQRLCDLRLVNDAAGLELAVRASVSEPTYFAPVYEFRSENIDPATYNGSAVVPDKRAYNGGYPMTIVTQDLKRRFPQMYAFGTGRTLFSKAQAALIHAWYRVPLNEAIARSRYWLDAEIPWSDAEWTKVGAAATTTADNVALGRVKFMSCVTNGADCSPGPGLAPPVTKDYSGTVDINKGLVGRPLLQWFAAQKAEGQAASASPDAAAAPATGGDTSGATAPAVAGDTVGATGSSAQ